MLETSELILKNRVSLQRAISKILSLYKIKISQHFSKYFQELKRMRQEKENYLLTKALIAAMEIGKVTGIPGKVERDSISLQSNY